MQYPVFPRSVVAPIYLLQHNSVHHVTVDCRLLTDTNDLGNLLAAVPGPSALHVVKGTGAEYLKRDGIVDEAARIFYEVLSNRYDPTTVKFCRNCKSHIPGNEFISHWRDCVEKKRWCPLTKTVVDAEKWDAHQEKLTMVVCLDCGAALEWRHWEHHRLSGCMPLLRELTTSNAMLPDNTRQNALQVGLIGAAQQRMQ